MLTVGTDRLDVERRLSSGLLACPGCGGRLSRWGYARARVLRDDGVIRWRFRPRRAICGGCGTTHVLLPATCLVRRADTGTVIGAALGWAAAGWGHRRIASRLGRPAATVRGWLRRFGSRAGPLRAAFTELLCALDADPVLPEPAGSDVADAVAAIVAAATAAARRWGSSVFTVSPWQLVAAATCAQLLAPQPAPVLINTSRPW